MKIFGKLLVCLVFSYSTLCFADSVKLHCDLFNKIAVNDIIQFDLRFKTLTIHEALRNSIANNSPSIAEGSWRILGSQHGYAPLNLEMKAKSTGDEGLTYKIEPLTIYLDEFAGPNGPTYIFNFTYDYFSRPIMSVTLTGPKVDAKGICYTEKNEAP